MDIRTIRKKEKNGSRLFKYEEQYYIKRLIKKCDEVASIIVRKRDEGQDCVSKGTKCCRGLDSHNAQCCHGLRRGYYSHRRDLRNLYAGCNACNKYGKQDHHNAITARIIFDYGPLFRVEMRETKSTKKPSLEQLKRILFDLDYILSSM